MCKFIEDNDDISIRQISVQDAIDGRCNMPFISPAAWKSAQHNCKWLHRTYSHLTQGTKPGRRAGSVKDLKRYHRVCSIGKNGLLVVRRQRPFAPACDLTVVPRDILPGILSALHIRLNHPTVSQLQKVFDRHFYGLDAKQEIDKSSTLCPQCASIAKLPKEVEEFSTSDVPVAMGTHFACDVLCRANLKIFVLRDNFSSYTVT